VKLPLILTVKEQVAVFWPASIAVHATVVVPFEKVEPEGGLQFTIAPEQLSVALAVKLTMVAHSPGGAWARMSPGQLRLGAWVSLTVTVNAQLVAFCELSVVVQFTVVIPCGNSEPEGGVHETFMPPLEQLSVAVARKLTRALHWPAIVLVTMLAGQAMAGL